MSVAKLLAVSKSAAPGPYLGYSLQQVRLCHRLLGAAEDSAVSFEYLDDIAVHFGDGHILLEQSKSALRGKPASDRSTDLWKAFANWADLCSKGLIDSATGSFRYYVSPTGSGKLVALMHAASAPDELTAALKKIKKLIDPKKSKVGSSPLIAQFLAAGDVICANIIAGFQFRTEPDPIECIRDQLRASFSPEVLDDFCAAAIGLARDRIDRLIRKSATPIIQASQFRRELRSFVRRYEIGSLDSTVAKPSTVEINAMINSARMFVRQLEAVKAPEDTLLTAVSDYLMTTSDKVNWADEGVIVRSSLDELDEKLERKYKLVQEEIEDTHGTHDEAQRGRIVYRKCVGTVLSLEGRELPSHFVPGSYNCLADVLRVGWHPKYKDLFPPD